MSSKLHMVPALINEDYIIRFAVCAQNANDDDVYYAWNVISEMASDVIAACDSNKENEALKEIQRIESLDIGEEVPLEPEKYETEATGDDEVFLYDDNIPSIPSIPKWNEQNKNGPNTYRRRNQLLRMISDPKCYNPRVLKSLTHEKRHRSETAKYGGSRGGSRDGSGGESRNGSREGSGSDYICNGVPV